MMTGLLKIAAVAAAGFYRCGQFWPHEGRVVDPAELDEEVLARLTAEPMLHVTPATGPQAEADQADALRARVKDAIGGLEAGDFAEDGSPRAEAVRRALKGTRGVTAALVAEVWAGLKPAD